MHGKLYLTFTEESHVFRNFCAAHLVVREDLPKSIKNRILYALSSMTNLYVGYVHIISYYVLILLLYCDLINTLDLVDALDDEAELTCRVDFEVDGAGADIVHTL